MCTATNLRNRLMDYLGPIDQDEHMVVDFSTCRVVVTPWMTIAACTVTVVLALRAIATMMWISTSQVSVSTVQSMAAAGSTSEMAEVPAEIHGSPGQETNPQAQTGPLVVLAVGLVANPDVVGMPVGMRMAEAIGHTSGPLPEANPVSINLAAPLVDGQQIVVGTEALPVGTAGDGVDISDGSGIGAAGIADSGGSDGKINIDIVSTTQLEGLPGIGPATATKIIGFRGKNGAFASIGTFKGVPGIGPAEVEVLRDATAV